MFRTHHVKPMKKPQQIHKQVYPSDVTPSGGTTKNLKETYSQSMMNYEIIRETVQNDFQQKALPPKKANAKKTLLNF